MDPLATCLSVTELSRRILDMATTGVYRESLFETFKPVATKRQIREAIAMAKQFGLQSNPSFRDAELGTYYQVDLRSYQRFQTAVEASLTFTPGEDVAARVLATTQTMQTMVTVARGVAIALMGLGSLFVLLGQWRTSTVFWSCALCAGGIWRLQRQLACRSLQVEPLNSVSYRSKG
jgi:hypothetical protein